MVPRRLRRCEAPVPSEFVSARARRASHALAVGRLVESNSFLIASSARSPAGDLSASTTYNRRLPGPARSPCSPRPARTSCLAERISTGYVWRSWFVARRDLVGHTRRRSVALRAERGGTLSRLAPLPPAGGHCRSSRIMSGNDYSAAASPSLRGLRWRLSQLRVARPPANVHGSAFHSGRLRPSQRLKVRDSEMLIDVHSSCAGARPLLNRCPGDCEGRRRRACSAEPQSR